MQVPESKLELDWLTWFAEVSQGLIFSGLFTAS